MVLLGEAGDRLAKALGHPDGQMPMHALIPGDYEPCDDCKARFVMAIEMSSERTPRPEPTGHFWRLTRMAFAMLKPNIPKKLYETVQQAGVLWLDPDSVDALHLRQFPVGGVLGVNSEEVGTAQPPTVNPEAKKADRDDTPDLFGEEHA